MAVDEMVGVRTTVDLVREDGMQMVLRELGKRPMLFDTKYGERHQKS